MSHPWEKGQDVGERIENDDAYRRFLIYLHLGHRRSYGKVAKILNVTRQAIHRNATVFNWQKRTEAFDEAKASGLDVSEWVGDDINIPFPGERLKSSATPEKIGRPKGKKSSRRNEFRASQAQQSVTQAVVEAHVLSPVLTSEQLNEQLELFREYRLLFETRSKKLLRQADDASDAVDKSYEGLQDFWDKWIWAVNKIYDLANSESTSEERTAAISYASFFALQTREATLCYKSYGEEQRRNLAEARLHLGECVGVQDVLAQFDSKKAIK